MTNREKRALRLKEAKLKGTHTKKEWQEMKLFFNNTCCKCKGKSELINVEKDHIIPLYLGGSDSIRNLQPLCALCNSSKTENTFDFRKEMASFLKKELPDNYKNPY